MKNKPENLFKKNRKLIIMIAVIITIFLAYYLLSLSLYPAWKNSTRGITILAFIILNGLLLNIKNIDDLIEKWFFKKDKYQFSEEEKEIIRWIYNEINVKRDKVEFNFGYRFNETRNLFISNPEELRNIQIPIITKGVLSKLMTSGLIHFDDNDNHQNEYWCRIDLVLTKKAIESNFKE